MKTLKVKAPIKSTKPAKPAKTAAPAEVILRTQSAGVHIGVLVSRNGSEAVLAGARRLWQWSGAFTLNAVATAGVNRTNSRISVPVPEITVLGVIEVIPVASGIDLSTTEKK